MRTLAAAAVQKGDVVLLARVEGGPRSPVTIVRVHNSEPSPGRITWDTNVEPVEIGAATRVEVVSLA